ncbi:dipeptide ABC transporter ATP-binding protein [Herbidospora cretacea]|uniref:dipeptide ABC transporter ATP-binding protein n=1 Tax=Herbidospora cretacea TaxID=28444 RepID=UPI0007740F8F|nr:ABC transporter ATP-binding protein [Herbidospora cretacea]
MIDVKDLSVSFGTTPAVRDLSFSVARGEILGLIGESGSGKSATALALMGLLPRTATTSGSILLDGEELTTASEKRLTALRGRAMAIVFQDPLQAFTPVHRVGAQIAEAVRAHQRVPRRTAARRAVELLDLVGIRDPHQRARSYPHEFSGGMRQRALIAMAIANNPGLLIADEPTTALDVTVQAHILDVLKTAQRETGAAVLLITHDLSVVARAADRVHVLKGGGTVETGPVEEVLRAPREPYTRRLVAAMEAGDRPAAPRPVRTVLEVRDLVRHHPGVKAVDGVSFDLRSGETLGLVGESGSGKTTLLMEIMALARPQRGRITVLGRDTAHVSRRDRRRIRRDLQIVFQDPSSSLDPRMTVGAIVAEPLTTHGRSPARVPELLAQVGLPAEYAARHPAHLSGGQRQRVAIARAVALDPEVLVLDEPVSALDPTIRAEIITLLEKLRAERGLSYLFVAHDLPLIRRIADRVAVMYRGRIAEIGPAHQIFAAPAHPYTRALLRASPLRDDDPVIAAGCRFRPRCPLYAELPAAPRSRCATEEPEITGDSGAACHHHPGEAP